MKRGRHPVMSQDGTFMEQWAEVLCAAPDASFQGELSAFLSETVFAPGLAPLLDKEILLPTRDAGHATAEQCAGAWYNVGWSALTLPQPTIARTSFALDCGRLATSLGTASPNVVLRAHWLVTNALLRLAEDEATTSPEVCKQLLAQAIQYVADVATQEDSPNWERAHAPPACATAIATLTHLIQRRNAIEALSVDLARLADTAASVCDRLSGDARNTLVAEGGLQTDPRDELRFLSASAHFARATDEGTDAAAHARAGLEAMTRLRSREALTEGRKALVVHMRSFLLLFLGNHCAAIDEIRSHGAIAGSLERTLRITEGQAQRGLGELDLARATLTSIADSKEDAVGAWRLSWLDVSDAPQVLPGVVLDNPLVKSQTLWRSLTSIEFELEDSDRALEWMDRANGFLVDSLHVDRERWAADMHWRLRKAPTWIVGWPSQGDADQKRVFSDLRDRQGVADGVPLPRQELAPAISRDPGIHRILTDLSDSLESMVLVQTLVADEKLFTAIVRLARDAPYTVELLPARPAKSLLERLQAWDQFYIDATRPQEPEAFYPPSFAAVLAGQGSSLLQDVVEEAGRVWAEALGKISAEGCSSVVFLADDILADVPFAALQLDHGKRLIESMQISFAPSMYSLWASTRRSWLSAGRRRGVALRCLCDPRLEGAKVEAQELAKTLETAPTFVEPASDDFWNSINEAQVLLISAHGRHNVALPLSSRLLYGWGDLGLDKLIAGLDLPRGPVVSNLICESGFPAIRRAPGVGFSSAFLAAGARNVLESTWTARNDEARALNLAFYRSWVEGKTAGESFRAAMVEIMEDAPTAYWAGFRLIGAP